MEKHQIMLVNDGILEALGKRLAGFIIRHRDGDDAPVSRGPSSAMRTVKGHEDGDKESSLPIPAPLTAQLAPLLDAISVIVKNNSVIIKNDSHRAHEFLYAPWILSAFPSYSQTKQTRPKPKPKANTSNPISPSLLTSSAFPPLSVAASYFPAGIPRGPYAEALPSSASDIMGDDSAINTPAPGSDAEDSPRKSGKKGHQADNLLEGSPLVRWLISTVRRGDAHTRLMAASLLTNLCQFRRTGPIVRTIECMVLPVLVRLLDDENSNMVAEQHKGGAEVGGERLPQRMQWIIRERAPAVLADLINDSEQMQKAAVEAHAVKKLAGMFKRTFDVASTASAGKETNGVLGMKSLGQKSFGDDDAEEENAKLVGAEANSPYKIHRMKVRESSLRCLSGLASLKDEYRKMVIDSGVVPYIVAALRPISEIKIQDPEPSSAPPAATAAAAAANSDESSPPGPNIVKEGNPPRVLIAAAYAIRSLSRSVSILRTNLVDAGVATPLMELLKNEDVEVKNAATIALCNLVLEFSPMRQSFLDMGVLKILCDQAHSPNAELKLNSVWALKHLVYSAENEVKTTALAQLGSGWLVELIGRDDDIGLNTGEEGYYDDDEGMVDEGEDTGFEGLVYQDHPSHADESEDSAMNDSIGQLSRPKQGSQSASSSFVEHEISSRAIRRARQQLLDVQEQGLDFLRNLICGNDSPEILDILFTGVGQDRVYDILARKLRSRPVLSRHLSRRSSRRPTTASSTESTPQMTFRTPSPEILVSVIYILVHIAANHPRHRETLIQQTELLKSLLPYFEHDHKEVRVGLVWLVINLTWKDDGADEVSCKARAMEVKKLGFMQKLEGLLHDKVLDVEERAKTGLYQIRLCLGET